MGALGAGALGLAPGALLGQDDGGLGGFWGDEAKVNHFPQIVIPDGPNAALSPARRDTIFDSRDVFAFTDPADLDGSRTDLVEVGKDYYFAARVQNVGAAPVFNALATFYLFREPLLPGAGLAGTEVERRRLVPRSRQAIPLLPALGERRVTSGPHRFVFFDPESPFPYPWDYVGAHPEIVELDWFLVAECFEPMTDPLDSYGPTFDVATDRHIATRRLRFRVPRIPGRAGSGGASCR